MAAKLELNSNLQNSAASRTLQALKSKIESAPASLRASLERQAKLLHERITSQSRMRVAPAPPASSTLCAYATFRLSILVSSPYITECTDPAADVVVVNNVRNGRVIVPIRGTRGDRMLKRAIVVDSILPAIHAIMTLPTDSNLSSNAGSPFLKRYILDSLFLF